MVPKKIKINAFLAQKNRNKLHLWYTKKNKNILQHGPKKEIEINCNLAGSFGTKTKNILQFDKKEINQNILQFGTKKIQIICNWHVALVQKKKQSKNTLSSTIVGLSK